MRKLLIIDKEPETVKTPDMKTVKKIKPFHIDNRGEISHLLDGEIPFTSALLVTSKKGSLRANHYHKKDTHYVFMLKGEMEYGYRNIKQKNNRKRKIIVKEGDLIFTPPMVAHVMRFLEDSIFLALTTEKRQQALYERDTVRINV